MNFDQKKLDNFLNKVQDVAQKSGAYITQQIKNLPDKRLIALAREGNEVAQEEAKRRHMEY